MTYTLELLIRKKSHTIQITTIVSMIIKEYRKPEKNLKWNKTNLINLRVQAERTLLKETCLKWLLDHKLNKLIQERVPVSIKLIFMTI